VAEQLGAAELQLDVNSSNFKTKLDAAEAQLLALQRIGDSVGISLNNIFAKNYRLNVTDSQVNAANLRLNTTLAKLKEITANPYNVRLNFIQSGAGTGGGGKLDPGRIVDDAIEQILKGGLSGQAADILRGGGGAGAGRVGAARSQQLRETLLARTERGSLSAEGYNIPGLQEIVRQLGQTPLPKTAGRAQILKQARETIQQASDAVINRIGQDLLDLQLSLQEEGASGAAKPKRTKARRPQGGARDPIRAQEQSEQKLLDNRLRIDKLEARGVDVARFRQQLARQEAAIQESAFERSRRISVELGRQLKTQEATLQVERLRAAAMRKQLGPKPPTPPPPPGPDNRNFLQRLGLGQGGKGGGLLQGSTRDAISSGTIGFGFPLLFGQGLGAAAGGGIGGLAGGLAGGGFGFALSIIGTAVGSQFDIIISKSKDLASALRDPIANFDLLKQNSQLSSRSTERYIEALIKVGREGEAAVLIQQDLANTYGNLDGARALSTAQDDLARSWTKLGGILSTLVLPGITDLTNGIAGLISDLNKNAKLVQTTPGLNAPSPETEVGNFVLSGFGLFPQVPKALQEAGAAARRSRNTPQPPAPPPPPEVLEAQKDRASLLSNELRLITAQTQGYKEQELSLKLSVAADKERVDLGVLNLRQKQATSNEERKALQVEIDARRTQTLKERIQLEEELAEVRRKNRITQDFRPAIQQQSLAIIDAQARGAQRQALIEERRLATLETERQLRLEGNRDPVRRGEILDQDLLTQARLTAQLNQLDKERAAFTRQTTFDAREQGQVAQRQLAFARQRLGLETGIARQTLEQREAVIESIAAARDRQKRAQFSFTEALRQGGDTGQQRAFEIASKDIPEAARQLQLSLINGATALKDAGREISRSIEDNARALQDLYLTSQFATGEQRQQALTDLDRQVQAEAERRNIRFTVSGTEQERIAAKQAFLGFGRQETELLNQSRQLADALAIATKPIVDSNAGLIGSQATLIEAINTLSQKDWNVNVAVASDGTVKPAGDLVPSYL
jgi:hypothetical protein